MQRSGLPWKHVIGLGTQLDTARFRGYLCPQAQGAADAGAGPDPGRTRRQHGADLVGGAGRGAAAGEISGVVVDPGRGTLHANEGKWCRGDQAQRRGGVSRWESRSGRSFTRSHLIRSGSCLSPRSSRGLMACATCCISVPTVVGRKGVGGRSKSSSGPRKCRRCSTRARCSGRRSTKFSKRIRSSGATTRQRPAAKPCDERRRMSR